ncbi:MAG: hypothetical protein U0U67_09655 [Chitinophagales bacterium]
MKKSILLTFVFTATIGAALLTGCGKDSAPVYKSDNYVGTYYGYFTLESLAFSNAALDTVIGKQLPDTLTISENGNTSDNIVTATSKVLSTTIDLTLTSETAADLAITNKSINIQTVSATGVTANGTTSYNTSTKFLTLHATATAGTVFGLPVLGVAKPVLGGYFTKQ